MINFLRVITISFLYFQINAQSHPVFKGTTFVNNGAMADDQIDTWKYKSYVFVTSTPGIARPISITRIYIQRGTIFSSIENNELFGNNISKISEIVNSKLKSEFISKQYEKPECYKKFYPISINEINIWIDKNFIYFEKIWDTSYLTDAGSECLYPSSVAKINLSEISNLIITK